MVEHHIQRDILRRLMYADALRFSELKPDGMESNIFMYHLKQLIGSGYIEKADGSYRLAAAGLSYVDGLSTENHKPRLQPKLIATLAICNKEGKWLLAERKIQPYIGTRMFPSGKQHRGETMTQHASRELQEKTGLTDVPLEFRGMADVQVSDASGALLTHAVAHVFAGKIPSRDLVETDRFRYVWHDFAVDTAPLMPGTREIYEQLCRPGNFSIEIAASTDVVMV